MVRAALVVSLLVAPAARAQPMAPTISLDVRSPRPAMLMHLEEGRPVERVCDAPCRAVVAPGRYVFTGPGSIDSQQFDLTGTYQHVRADVSLGSQTTSIASYVALYTGPIVTTAGLYVLPFAFVHAQPSDSIPVVEHNVARVLAPALLTVGIATIIGGFMLMRESHSRLTLTPVP